MNKWLLLILSLSLLAGTNSMADHKDGHNPGSGPPSGSGNPTFVVMDSDTPPKPVGEVIGFASPVTMLVQLPIGDFVTVVHLQANDALSLRPWGEIFFLTSDCTGDKYIWSESGGLWNLLDNVAIVPLLGAPDSRVPFVPTGEAQELTANSYIDSRGTCRFNPFISEFYVADQLADDLHVTYPRPYTLVEQ